MLTLNMNAKMRQPFVSVDEAINTIIDSAQIHAQATTTGSYKIANKNYDLINKAVTYLKQNDGIESLKGLLKFNEVSVRAWVASYLIKDGDQQAISVLQEIASMSIPHQSFAAELVLREWEKNKH